MNTFQICWNTVGTPFRLVGTLFEHLSDWLEQCSNTFHISSNSVQTLFRSVQTVFGHAILPFHVFKQCSNSLPCDGVLFEHCSNSLSLFGNVRTLFRQCLDMLYSLSMCSNSVRTARSCPPPAVSPFFFSFLSPLLFFFLFTAIHVRPQAHSHTPIHNTSTRPSARSENQ